MARKSQKQLKGKLAPGHPFYEVIEEAYRVFDAATPTSIDVCENCCMDPKIEADFFNPPIRELPLHYVWDWYFAAYDPGGVSKATWAFLLPRILELLASEQEVCSVGSEVVLQRFPTGDRSNWSDAQWHVLDRFQRLYLERAVSLDETLCMFALGGWPLDDLTAQVLAWPDPVLTERLWQDWCGWGKPAIWLTAFWDEPQRSTIYAFYRSPALQERMERLALAGDTPDRLAQKASAVADVIDHAPAEPA